MYKLQKWKVEKIEPVTFSELKMRESDMEEIFRGNINILCDSEEESMLIVGRQVRNEKSGRSDLTAVDNEGNIILIEIKRDQKDIENRKEAFEFQAIRYAASYATINIVEELVKKVYAPYIEKYQNEFEKGELTSYEYGIRKLKEFLQMNYAENMFNRKQKIILAASDYDEQTLSAVAWLNKNNVDIKCCRLILYKLNEEVYLSIEKLLPISDYNDYYVNLMDKSEQVSATVNEKKYIRNCLPKIDSMLRWGVVKEGDIIAAKGRKDEGMLLANGKILVNGEEKSIQEWLKKLYGWSSVQTYVFSIHKESGKTLSQIRSEYMEQAEQNDSVEGEF